MQSEEAQGDAAASQPLGNGLTRRQAIGRLTALAGAGAAAWVVPEILTATPASGATLSGPVTGVSTVGFAPVSTSKGPGGGSGGGSGGTPLAFTGLNIERDAQIGAALIAGGWAMKYWASRTAPSPRPPKGPDTPS